MVDRLRCLRGIRTSASMVILSEVDDLRRFASARHSLARQRMRDIGWGGHWKAIGPRASADTG